MISLSKDPSVLMIREDIATLKDALSVIQDSKEKVALIVDKQSTLVGLITDGDIRRGLLSGNALNSLAVNSMPKNKFTYITYQKEGLSNLIIRTIKEKKTRQLPILDNQGAIVDLYFVDDSTSPLPNHVVLMAGGKGTRLYPFTRDCPKPMIEVNGIPMLEILISNCISKGLSNFYISVNHLKEQIMDYFQDGSKWGVSINYLIEDEPLGTAGALSLLPNNIEHPFIVMNSDVLTRLNLNNLISFHRQQDSIATLCVAEHPIKLPFGVVDTKGYKLNSFEEKPTFNYLINAGVYILNPSILPLITKSKYQDMPSLLMLAKHKDLGVSVFPIHEYWLDVGNPKSLEEANLSWKYSN